jgi:hypothetical protein
MKLSTFMHRKFGIDRATELATMLGMHPEAVRRYWTGARKLSPIFAQKLQKKLPEYVALDDLLKLKK